MSRGAPAYLEHGFAKIRANRIRCSLCGEQLAAKPGCVWLGHLRRCPKRMPDTSPFEDEALPVYRSDRAISADEPGCGPRWRTGAW